MNKVWICQSKIAGIPLYLPEQRVNLYSLEELCYYLCQDAEVIEEQFFDEKLVDFVASDTHFTRSSMLANAREVITKRYGEQVANDVFYNNAKTLILDKIKG